MLVGGVIVAGGLTLWYTSTQQQPTGHTMTPTDTSSIAQGAPIVQVTLPDELSTKAKMGKRAFEAKCATCHGANGAGQNGVAPPFINKIYEPAHHGDLAFVRAAKNGVQSHHWNFGNMPPVQGVTDGDVKNIATYIRELQRANGIK